MLSFDKLIKTKNVFFHSGCPDGIAAREILKKIQASFDTQLNFIPYYFEQPILGTEREALVQDALFIDIHPPKTEWKELESKYDFLVADHHATSASFMIDSEKYLRGENTRAESGAMLAAQISEVVCKARYKDIFDFATIIAISDTWQTDHPDFKKARNLAQYILLFGDRWEGFIHPEDPLVQAYAKVCEDSNLSLADHAILRERDGFRLAFINTSNTSDVAEILRPRGINVIVGWKVLFLPDKGEVINYSLRSDESISVRAIAERIGGGGHNQAAGCSTAYKDQNPIEHFLGEFTSYISTLS